MTFEELAVTRISEKFRKGNNFKNVLKYMVSMFDDQTLLATLLDMRNIDSDSYFVLDEIGKLMGAFPRPRIRRDIRGGPYVQWDRNGLDKYPFYHNTDGNTRALNNDEYRRYLKAVAQLKNIRGTVDEWERFFADLSGKAVYITNNVDAPMVHFQNITDTAEIEYLYQVAKRLHNITTEFELSSAY